MWCSPSRFGAIGRNDVRRAPAREPAAEAGFVDLEADEDIANSKSGLCARSIAGPVVGRNLFGWLPHFFINARPDLA